MKRLAFTLILAGTMFGAASVRPQQLRCEYRVNPRGIDVTEPRLSWVLTPVRSPKQITATKVAFAASSAARVAGSRRLRCTPRVWGRATAP